MRIVFIGDYEKDSARIKAVQSLLRDLVVIAEEPEPPKKK
jgi:hypothetical protein